MLVTANVVRSSKILFILMIKAIRSSETSVLTTATQRRILFTLVMEAIHFLETSIPTRATQRHIPEDGILHSHCLENLKSYIGLTGWIL
jgi:hypothetical protein